MDIYDITVQEVKALQFKPITDMKTGDICLYTRTGPDGGFVYISKAWHKLVEKGPNFRTPDTPEEFEKFKALAILAVTRLAASSKAKSVINTLEDCLEDCESLNLRLGNVDGMMSSTLDRLAQFNILLEHIEDTIDNFKLNPDPSK